MNAPTQDLVLGGFQCNEGYSIQEEGTLEVLFNCWVAGGKVWTLVH